MDEARAAWVMERLTRCEEFHIGRQVVGRRLMCAACVADAVAQAVKERDEEIVVLRRHLSVMTLDKMQQAEEIARYKNGCWVWPKVNGEGYGNCRDGLAHRRSWEAFRGPIPADLQIDHLCRNRACVNPGHMELVTRKENILRGQSPQALNGRKTECPQGHQYTYTHQGKRYCKPCRLAATERWRARRRTEAAEALRRAPTAR